MPPPPEGRAGNIWVYLVSFLLFLSIVTGGAFLVLYMTLPESEDTIWFPIVGLVLVCMPWFFWTSTCLYRTVAPRNAAREGGANRAAGRAAAAGPATGGPAATAVDVEVAGGSPGGAGREPQEVPGGGGGDRGGRSSGKANGEPAMADGSSHATHRSSVSNDDALSLTSHESEVPLFPMPHTKK